MARIERSADLPENGEGRDAAETARPRFGACSVSSERLGNGIAVVSVAGEVDLYTAPLLSRALSAALEANGHGIVVDLAECEFVDSAALGTLVEANARLGERDRRLSLVAPEGGVRRAIELMGLDRVFALHESRASVLGGVCA